MTSNGNEKYDVELPDDPDSFVDDNEGKYYMFVTNTESPNDSKTVESYFCLMLITAGMKLDGSVQIKIY